MNDRKYVEKNDCRNIKRKNEFSVLIFSVEKQMILNAYMTADLFMNW